MAIQPNRPQTIGRVLDIGFDLVRRSGAGIWWFAVVISLLSTMPSVYSLLAMDEFSIAEINASQGFTYYGMVLVTMMVSMLSYATGGWYFAARADDPGTTFRDALRATFSKIHWLLLMVIGVVVALLVGLVLLIVPGIILMISLSMSPFEAMLADKKPIEALTGSHRLVWGNWWRVFAVYSVAGLILMVAYTVLGAIVAVVLRLAGIEEPVFMVWLTSVIVGGIAGVLVLPYFSALMVVVYWDLKLRKDGADLAARIEALPAAPISTANA